MYPPCPDAKEWEGVSIDAASLVKATKGVLYAGTVPVSKDSVYRGKHGNLCFSQEVHDKIVQNLDPSLVVKIKDFLNEGERLERQILNDSEPPFANGDRGSSTVSTLGSIGSAPSFKKRSDSRENARLRIENAFLKNQLSVQGQTQLSQRRPQRKGSELEMKDSSKTLTESAEIETMEKELEKAKRDLRRCQYSASRPNQFSLGGKLRTGVPVNNLVFHPRKEKEPAEKGKRLPTLCNESVVVVIHGSKEHRPGGGWRYTVKAKLNEFNIWRNMGIDAAHRSPWLRELDFSNQVMETYIIPTPRDGCKTRRKLATYKQARCRGRDYNGFRLHARPSPRTVRDEIIPAFLNLFGLWVVKILEDSTTVRVGVSEDGYKARGCGILGTFITVYQRKEWIKDPLGNSQKKTECLRFPGPMTQISNKLVKTLKDSRGVRFPPEAAYGMAKAFFVGNLAGWFLKNGHMIDFCLDAGSENTGVGPKVEAMERLCGENSVMEQTMLSRGVWPDVIKDAEATHLKKPLDSFFGNQGMIWEAEWSQEKLALASSTLDTKGPVYKDPDVVKFLQGYQNREVEGRIQKVRAARLIWMRLRASLMRRPKHQEVLTDEKKAKFLKVKPDKDPAKHHRTFLFCMTASRMKASRLYKKRVEESSKAPHGRSRHVSMKKNPLRHLPCRRRPDGKLLGLANHCFCHRIHNISDDYVKSLNEGLLDQVVSFAKFCSSDFFWPKISAVIDRLMGYQSKSVQIQDTDTEFLAGVRARVDLGELAKRCKYNVASGACAPVTVGRTRWATTFGAMSYAFWYAPLLAFAKIKWWSEGPVEVRIDAAVKVLNQEGFNSDEFTRLMLDKCASRQFAFCTNPSDVLQLAIGHVLNAIVVKPLLAAIAANYETGAELTKGLESKVRRILLVLRRDMWVRCFPFRSWGRDWNRTNAIGCRTHGAEFEPEASILLFHTNCKARVQARLGDWPEMDQLVLQAAEAPGDFLDVVKKLAKQKGQLLPADSQRAWSEWWTESHPHMKARPDFQEGCDSQAGRLSQAFWLLRRVCDDSAEAIIQATQRELFALYGSLANMNKTLLTEKYTFRNPDGGTFDSPVLIPDKFAIPNTVNQFVMVRDLRAHYREKGIEPDELMKHLPTWGRVVGDKCFAQMAEFGGFNVEPGQTTANHSITREEWARRRCHEPNHQGAYVVKAVSNGEALQQLDESIYENFEKPLSCFADLHQCSEVAGHILGTSKGMESIFSHITVNARSKPSSTFRALEAFGRRHAYETAGLDPAMALENEDKYWEAEVLVKEPGWAWVYKRDTGKAERMDEAHKEAKLGVRVRGGAAYKVTRHGISSRTPKYRKKEAAANKKAANAAAGNMSQDSTAKQKPKKRPRPLDKRDLALRKRARAVLGAGSAHASSNSSAAQGARRKPVPSAATAGAKRTEPTEPRLDSDPGMDQSAAKRQRVALSPGVASVSGAVALAARRSKRRRSEVWPSNESKGRQDADGRRSGSEGRFSGIDGLDSDSSSDLPLARRSAVIHTKSSDKAAGEHDDEEAAESGSKGPGMGIGGKNGGGGGVGKGGRGRGFLRRSRGRGDGKGGWGGTKPSHSDTKAEKSEQDDEKAASKSAAKSRCRGSGGGGEGEGVVADNSDDDKPLFSFEEQPPQTAFIGKSSDKQKANAKLESLTGVVPEVAQIVPAGAQGLRPAAANRSPNVWGMSFCFSYYDQLFENQGEFQNSKVLYVLGKGQRPYYEVTRQMKDITGGNIRIPVRTGDQRMYYIAYTGETGPILVNVISLHRCKGDDYSRTLNCYRVYTSQEAVRQSDRQHDQLDEKGQEKALGQTSLQRIAEDDKKKNRKTYHCGDRPYWLDVRSIVGVVLWEPAISRDQGKSFSSYAAVSVPRNKVLTIYIGRSASELCGDEDGNAQKVTDTVEKVAGTGEA